MVVAVTRANTPARRFLGQSFGRTVIALAALGVVTLLLWCAVHDKWTHAAWQVPLDYSGDAAETLARIKAAKEGELVPFLSQTLARLGAPFGAVWNEYPSSDSFANYGLGMLARVTGVGMASNLALWFAHFTAVLAFYGCARVLRYSPAWACAGALLFGFAPFNFVRGLPHLWLVFTATVPLALLVCWLVGGSQTLVRRRAVRWAAVAVALGIGSSNPYNLFLFLQLIGWATLAAFLRKHHAGARLGVVCIGAALAMAALAHLPTWIHNRDEGATPLLVRNYAGTEVYALKPIELFLPPPTHHSSLLASLGHRYVRWSDWRGETFSPYLGLVAGCGWVWLMVVGTRALLASRRPRLPAGMLQSGWIMLFASVGGLNALLAFFAGLQVFRATNRFSIFLLAIGLFFLVARLSVLTRRWPGGWRWAAALGLVAVGWWDQVPRRLPPEQRAELTENYAEIRTFGRELEAALTPGAMVFQLPVLEFPEGRPRHGLNPLDKFHPYLATDTLRFSFGSRKNRSKSQWKIEAERQPVPELVRRLEQAGFSALLIERKGFEDRAAGLLAELAAAGRAELVPETHPDYAVIRLQPVAHPEPPLAAQPTLGRGWYPPIPGSSLQRWAHGSAMMSYFNPYAHALEVEARLVLRSPNQRRIVLQHEGEPVSEIALEPDQSVERTIRVTLKPGVNRFDLITREPAIRRSEQRWGLRAFGLEALEWRVTKPVPGSAGDN